MVKDTRLDSSNPFSPHKHKHLLCVKFAVSLLLMGLAFRLLASDSLPFSPQTVEPKPVVDKAPPLPIQELSIASNEETSLSSLTTLPMDPNYIENGNYSFNNNEVSVETNEEPQKCDLFKGDWIPDSSGPRYTNETCRVIESHQNCMRNGRPDSGYVHWRWSPRGCQLPQFDPLTFLDRMRHKSWAFIGDSISRNHVQSLICTLSQVEEAVEVYHDKEFRSKRWHFPSYNFTVSVIWTPFLAKADIFEDINGISTSAIQLHLDELDNTWTDLYESLDYVIIAGGKWFLKTAIFHENSAVTGCHYCPGKNLTELGFEYSYRKVVRLVLNFVVRSKHRPVVFFRTTTPDHFENGEWFSGGYCNRTVPFKEGQIEMRDLDRTFRSIELEEFAKATEAASKNEVHLRLLDTTQLSLLRPDGHPGPYRQFQPFAEDKNAKVQTDCLHWCLPGPIDSWNDLIMELLLNADNYL